MATSANGDHGPPCGLHDGTPPAARLGSGSWQCPATYRNVAKPSTSRILLDKWMQCRPLVGSPSAWIQPDPDPLAECASHVWTWTARVALPVHLLHEGFLLGGEARRRRSQVSPATHGRQQFFRTVEVMRWSDLWEELEGCAAKRTETLHGIYKDRDDPQLQGLSEAQAGACRSFEEFFAKVASGGAALLKRS